MSDCGRLMSSLRVSTVSDVEARVWLMRLVDAERYYGFSKFSVELNETTEMEQGFAATDSRLRPDQLALERGDIDEAEETKKRVEEKQRAKRTAGTTPPPQHFIADGDGWKYSGQYCESNLHSWCLWLN